LRLLCLVLTCPQRDALERVVGLPTSTQRAALRALIVLHVADGIGIRETARILLCQPATVRKWCRRFVAGDRGLADAQRSGRPRRITAAERHTVVAAACATPASLGFDGYSVLSGALLAKALVESGRVAGISGRTVLRILNLADMKPHRCAYWKRSTDPNFDTKMRPIVELYLNPPDDGPVWCIDEKTCIQALERRFPDLPLRRPGEIIRREAEYVRHGTRCLTAGLEVSTGRIIGRLTPRRPKQEFIAFLDLLDAQVPAGQVIHGVVDNLNTHRGDLVEAWKHDHPGRLELHYLPFYASWLNQIELWFNTLQRRCLKRGDFVSADDLVTQITAFIATYNRLEAHPYRWSFTGDPLAA
jgi:transposase